MPKTQVEDREEKIMFLEKILKLARENLRVVGKGATVFVDSCPPPLRGGCYISVHLTKKGKPFFRYGLKEGQGGTQDYYTANEVLEAAQKYFPKSFPEFERVFNLYDTRKKAKKPNKEGRRKAVDLLDAIR